MSGLAETGRTSVVHKLQRERGVTCGWVASGGRSFAPLLEPAREATDGTRPSSEIASLVHSIRDEAEQAVRALTLATQSGDAHAAIAAEEGLALAFYSVFRRWNLLLQQALSAPAEEIVAKWAPEHATTSDVANARVTASEKLSERNTLPEDAASRLDPQSLSAFEAFALLKESTGIERAFLCGALALPEAALPKIPTRAFADLVIGMQQQRVYEERVKRIAPPKTLELLRAGFELEPELQSLQNRLLLDFDIAALRSILSAEACWQMMTKQIDKLETLQFLLFNHMIRTAGPVDMAPAQKCLSISEAAVPNKTVTMASDAVHTVSLLFETISKEADATELIRCLTPINPVLLKAEIIRRLASVLCESPLAETPATDGCESTTPSEEVNDSPTNDGDLPSERRRAGSSWQEDSRWKVSLDRLLFERRVGAGAAGTTYRAELDGFTTVCVKVAGGGGAERASWRTEVELLTRIRHPNIVRCLGVVIEPPTIGLVLEFISGLDLTHFLRNPTPAGFTLTVSHGVAKGMAHLHHLGVLHRDLKGGNVMVGYDENAVYGASPLPNADTLARTGGVTEAGTGGVAGGRHADSATDRLAAAHSTSRSEIQESPMLVKIIDLGLAAPAPDDSAGGWLTAETGTYRWMAPEVILNQRYSRPADVYSYAMVVYELLTHQVPFADRPSIQAAISCAVNEERPLLPSGCPSAIVELVNKCVEASPADRPTFGQIQSKLEAIMTPGALSPDEILWLDAPSGHKVYLGPDDGVTS